jgi:hypothetical protein
MNRRTVLKNIAGIAPLAVRQASVHDRYTRATRAMPSPRIRDVKVIATSPNGLRLVVVKVVSRPAPGWV